MKEQLEVADMTWQIEGTHLELHKIGENDTTQENDKIFVWKDIWKKVEMSCDSLKVIDSSMQPQTQSNVSDTGSISTGIVASSMLSHSRDSDGPMTVSSGIDAASLSDSRLGSEILETLPSSPTIWTGTRPPTDTPTVQWERTTAASHHGEGGCRVAGHGDQDGGQHQGCPGQGVGGGA